VPDVVRGRAEFFTITGIGISSTDIRARARRGASIRYRTPDAVVAHIEQRNLYPASS